MFEQRYTKIKELLYNELSKAEYGTAYSYHQIAQLIGFDVRQKRAIILAVQKMLEAGASRSLRNDRGLGYSVTKPGEHIGLADKRHKRAKKQLRRARSIIHATDKSALTPADRARIDNIEMILSAQADAIRHLERGQKVLQVNQVQISQSLESKIEQALKRIEMLEVGAPKDNTTERTIIQ